MAVEDIIVAEMTATQLRELIQSAVKETLQEILGDPDAGSTLERLFAFFLTETLQEILGDPDAGLELRPEFEERLCQAADYVSSGGHLLSVEELTSQLEGASGV